MSAPNDESPIAKNEEPEPEPEPEPSPVCLMSRHLQTFSPDLEVAVGVGKDQRLYRYHSVILASHSLYVDAFLSFPAENKDQGRRRINFPEIEVETWEKMMKYLSPNLDLPTLDDLMEIIPHYCQFQFEGGISYCDHLISRRIPKDGDFSVLDTPALEYIQKLSQLVSSICPFDFFPLSKPAAIKWAGQLLIRLQIHDEEMFRRLIPLVESDPTVIKSMVSTTFGRIREGMTMNEMRASINQPDFPDQYMLRCRQIKEIDEQVRHLNVSNLTVHVDGGGTHQPVKGDYELRRSGKFQSQYGHDGGAARGVWRKRYSRGGEDISEIMRLESLDFFGSIWEIYALPFNDSNEISIDEGCEQDNRRVLFRWESSVSTSSIPPKHGWKMMDDSGNAAGTKICLSYSLGGRASW